MRAHHPSLKILVRAGLCSLILLVAGGAVMAEDAQPGASIEELRQLMSSGRYSDASATGRLLVDEVRQSGGPDSLELAEALDLLVEALARSGRGGTQETVALAEHALEIKEAALGSDHPDLAKSLYNLGRLHQELRDLETATALMERSLAVSEKAHGSGHPETIRALNSLGMLRYFMMELDEARSLLERALENAEKSLGPDHPALAESLNSLAVLLQLQSNFEEAKRLFDRSLAIREKVLGPDHPDVAVTLSNLSTLHMEIGDYEASKRFDTRCLEIRERALGADNPLVARSLDNLSVLLMELGELDTARRYSERAAKIHAANLGSTHPDVAISLSNLAAVLSKLGKYAEARDLLEWCLNIQENSPTVHPAALAVNLNELGQIQYHMGDPAASLRTMQRSHDLWIEFLGPDHPEVGVALLNLSPGLEAAGDYAASKRNLERALEIWQNAYGSEHQNIGNGEYSLALVLQKMGDLEGAQRHYELGVAVLEKALGPEHPKVAQVLNDLGTLRAQRKDLKAAEPILVRSLEIREKLLGPDHPDVALSLNALATLHWQTGRTEQALNEALRAEAIVRHQVQHIARSLSDREALQYEQILDRGLDVAGTILADANPDSPARTDATARVWDAVVRSRALVLSEMAHRAHALANIREELSGMVSALDKARGRLARVLVEGADAQEPKTYRTRLDAALQEKEHAERALARKSLAIRRELEERNIGLAEVKRALPGKTALVALVRYNHLGRTSPGKTKPSSWPEEAPAYLAFVLGSPKQEPAIVSLGSAQEVDAAVEQWHASVSEHQTPLPLGQSSAEEKYRRAASRLREIVWDPIAEQIGNTRQILVVPDGALHLVSFATLPDARGEYLVETGRRFHYLSSERGLIQTGSDRDTGEGLLVLGGVDFDAASGPALLAQAGDIPTQQAPRAGERGAAPAAPLLPGVPLGEPVYRQASCDEYRALRFSPLPNSRAEVDEIASLWQNHRPESGSVPAGLIKLTGAGAQEAAVKTQAIGKRILHFATHSFVPSVRCSRSTAGKSPAQGQEKSRGKTESVDLIESPLLRAGLALAGANQRQKASAEEEDGILTAEEIAGLNLEGIEWAVLSACETGLGKVQAGEGVLGLRRAFEIAGVDTLIMSLWEVEDEAARSWMRELYEARLEGQSTAEAMHGASTKLIRDRRRAGRSTHPAFWGAFVAAGDWR